MNIQYPKVAILVGDNNEGQLVAALKKINSPLEIEVLSELADFRLGTQVLFIGSEIAKNVKFFTAIKDRMNAAPIVYSSENEDLRHGESLLRRGEVQNIIEFGKGTESLDEQVGEVFETFVRERRLKISTPLGVLGGGMMGAGLVREVLRGGYRCIWYDKILSDGAYEILLPGFKPKRYGYEEMINLHEMDVSLLTTFGSLEEFIDEDPGICVFADSEHSPIPVMDRRLTPWKLAKSSMGKINMAHEALERANADPLRIYVSNPSAPHAGVAVRKGTSPWKSLIASGDFDRARRAVRKLGLGVEDIVLMGDHENLCVAPELYRKKDGKYSQGHDDEEISRELAVTGPRVMGALKVTRDLGGEFALASYTATQVAVAENISRIMHLGRPECGYFFEEEKYFGFGEPPRIDVGDLTVHPEHSEHFTKVHKSYWKDLEPIARAQKRLVERILAESV